MEPDFVDVSMLLGCGVYALLYQGKVVYVGQSKLMLRRMYDHSLMKGKLKRNAPGRGKERFRYDEVWVKPCSIDELDALEATMIAKYAPRYNLLPRAGAAMPPVVRDMIDRLAAPVGSQILNRRGL